MELSPHPHPRLHPPPPRQRVYIDAAAELRSANEGQENRDAPIIDALSSPLMGVFTPRLKEKKPLFCDVKVVKSQMKVAASLLC